LWNCREFGIHECLRDDWSCISLERVRWDFEGYFIEEIIKLGRYFEEVSRSCLREEIAITSIEKT